MPAATIQAATHGMLCHLQKLLKPCPRSSSSVWALMLGPMKTARKMEKQQGPECHDRDIDLMGAEDGPKGSSNNAARPSRRAPASGRHLKGAASRPLERGSQCRIAPKLGKIGTECGTTGTPPRLQPPPGPGAHSEPGGMGGGRTGIVPPSRGVRPPVTQARAKQGRLLAPTSSQDWSQLRCREARAPEAQAQANQGSLPAPTRSLGRSQLRRPRPSQPKAQGGGEVEPVLGPQEIAPSKPGGRHRPPQRLPRSRRLQKRQLPYRPGMQPGTELRQLDAELLGPSPDGPNGELNVLAKDLRGTRWSPSCTTLPPSQNGRISST